MSTFTTISPSAIQQLKRPYEQPQDPFWETQAQQTDQVPLKKRETDRFRKFYYTELIGFARSFRNRR